MALDFDKESAALLVRTAAGATRTPVGLRSWTKARRGFANGLERGLGVPAQPLVASGGAWSSDDVFTVKLALVETPFSSTLTFHFDGDRLLLDAEHNVAFGPTKQAQLVGRAGQAQP